MAIDLFLGQSNIARFKIRHFCSFSFHSCSFHSCSFQVCLFVLLFVAVDDYIKWELIDGDFPRYLNFSNLLLPYIAHLSIQAVYCCYC